MPATSRQLTLRPLQRLRLLLVIILISCIIPPIATQYYLQTIAGTGTATSTGDGGPASSATLTLPRSVWTDTTGNIYIAEDSGNRVRLVTTLGFITTLVGSGSYGNTGAGGAAGSVNLDGAFGVYGDSGRNYLYFSGTDYFVWSYEFSSGMVSRFAGFIPATAGYSGDGGQATSAKMSQPRGIFLSTSGILYVVDKGNQRIRMINTANGIINNFAGNGGTGSYSGDNVAATSSALYNPTAVWGNTAGIIFIADYNNNRVRKVDTSGIITTFAGTGSATPANTNVAATSANLNNPSDMKGDTMGNMYIVEYTGCRIRVVSTSGIISTIIGTGTCSTAGTSVQLASSATIGNVYGIWVDTQANIYYAETNSNSVKYIYYVPESVSPTNAPTQIPTNLPTPSPSNTPTLTPSAGPTYTPSYIPTQTPSVNPTYSLTNAPTLTPSVEPTCSPSHVPTQTPSMQPTYCPSCSPTQAPSAGPTHSPSYIPTPSPSLDPTCAPTNAPTQIPTQPPSRQPTCEPTYVPTQTPSAAPTYIPSYVPTENPTTQPTCSPSYVPTLSPSAGPTYITSYIPTQTPTIQPTCSTSNAPSLNPSAVPTCSPTNVPTQSPSTQPTCSPSCAPTQPPSADPTYSPSCIPTLTPSTDPTSAPTTLIPSNSPSGQPTCTPSSAPTLTPSEGPTQVPSAEPTCAPTTSPTTSPTTAPSAEAVSAPTVDPTLAPSAQPTYDPSIAPTCSPSNDLTLAPSVSVSAPSLIPTAGLSCIPTNVPTQIPSAQPTYAPTIAPTQAPSTDPTTIPPTLAPSAETASAPTIAPTLIPSAEPTYDPIIAPTQGPTFSPSNAPTQNPSEEPTCAPTFTPTHTPSTAPSTAPAPTQTPSEQPTCSPSYAPTQNPSKEPSIEPSIDPTQVPSASPTCSPSNIPTLALSIEPIVTPSTAPTQTPSAESTCNPTNAPTQTQSEEPTPSPSNTLTQTPSRLPSCATSNAPTQSPSAGLTCLPTNAPTRSPSQESTCVPTNALTHTSSGVPTCRPSQAPTHTSSYDPTFLPSTVPTLHPINQPLSSPTFFPTLADATSRAPSCSPFLSPTTLVFTSTSNSSVWKDIVFLLGSFSFNQGALSLLDSSGALEGVSSIIFGNRALSSASMIDASFPSSSHYPVAQISPTYKRDATTRSAVIPGDLNGDRFNDLIVCYPLSSSCYIFFGSGEDGLRNVRIGVTIYGLTGSFLGFAVAAAEDVNEDGYADVIISALVGKACYVIYGRPQSSWQSEMRVSEMRSGGRISEGADGYKILADATTTLTGLSVAGLGDMNGDGKGDLAISVQRGASYIVYVIWGEGREGGKDMSLSEVGNGVKGFRVFGEEGYYTGLSISRVGDVNEDGLADLVIGAIPYPGRGKSPVQKSYLILGSSSISDMVLGEGMVGKGVVMLVGGGLIVSGPGDVNNDGIEDIMITDVRDYLSKGNAYIISYPGKMSSPPSFLPSSLPSSPPSNRPSSEPSSSYPTNSPSIGSFNSSFSPSFMNVTSNSSMYPSLKPSARVKPSRSPSHRPSNQPISYAPSALPTLPVTRPPSYRPTTVRTKQPNLTLPPSRAPTRFPTTRPSTIAPGGPSPSPSSLLLPSTEYHVRAVNASTSNKQGIIQGREGSNEIFEISSMSQDGKRRSGWSGTIIGGRGRKIYRIYPKDPSQPVNRIVLQDFDSSKDVIDLSHISKIGSKADLTYLTHPLTLFLPDNQKIILSSYNLMTSITESNFIFQSSSGGSEGSSSPSNSSAYDWFVSLSFAIPMVSIIICMIISYRSNQGTLTDKKSKDEVEDFVNEPDEQSSEDKEGMAQIEVEQEDEEERSHDSSSSVRGEVVSVLQRYESDHPGSRTSSRHFDDNHSHSDTGGDSQSSFSEFQSDLSAEEEDDGDDTEDVENQLTASHRRDLDTPVSSPTLSSGSQGLDAMFEDFDDEP